MKVNVINRKLIKPWTPTPQNLRKHKISFIDELLIPMNISVILFYPPPTPNHTPSTTIHRLQKSLAQTLPRFYPLAGRYLKYDDHHFVDCCDEGAEFVEAEAVGDAEDEIMDVVSKMNNDQLNELLPRQPFDVDKPQDPMLSVQVTAFKCGGLAVAISMSHRVADGSSLGTLIAAWSNINADVHPAEPINPTFDSSSLFPGVNFQYDQLGTPPNIVVKKLLFNKEAISSLRSKLRPKNEQVVLSRVRLATAVITKALIGVELAKYGKSRPFFIGQGVNMRTRTTPPLPKHSCGNLVALAATQCMAENETKEMRLQELVDLIGDSIDETIDDIAKILSLDMEDRFKILSKPLEIFIQYQNGENNAAWFTDWSKFGFYQTDFGWGKPVWVRVGNMRNWNIMILVEDKEGGGIEVWVNLNENDVPYFEQDEDMKLFTIA